MFEKIKKLTNYNISESDKKVLKPVLNKSALNV